MSQMTPTPAQHWNQALGTWAIPDEILAVAPESPWVHPPALFRVDDPQAAPALETPSLRAARQALSDPVLSDPVSSDPVSSGAVGLTRVVLDVGCGGGASSLGLAPLASLMIGVDEQAAMLEQFTAACRVVNVACETFCGKWQDIAATVPLADVVVCHHVVYNVGDIEPFLQALTAHARRRVVIELPSSHPTAPFNPLWKHFWGLKRPTEPTAALFEQVVRSLGWSPTVERFTREPRKQSMDRSEYVAFVRQRLCLPADRDHEVAELLMTLGELRADELVTVSWDAPS